MQPVAPPELDLDIPVDDRMALIKRSTLVAAMTDGQPVLMCFVCVAKAERVGEGHALFDEYCWKFSANGKLVRYFVTSHLNHHKADDNFECPICQVTLIHKKHLQNHTEKIHGICTVMVYKRERWAREEEILDYLYSLSASTKPERQW